MKINSNRSRAVDNSQVNQSQNNASYFINKSLNNKEEVKNSFHRRKISKEIDQLEIKPKISARQG